MMKKRLLTLKRSTIAFKFYINLFKKNVSKLDSEKESFLNSIALPNLGNLAREGSVSTTIFSLLKIWMKLF